MIKNFKKFETQLLLESILNTSTDFREIIYRISNSDKPEAASIANFLNRSIAYDRDIKTNYNALGLSDKNDEISFLQDKKFQKLLGENENPWSKTMSKSKIGRLIRQILTDNDIKFTDKGVEEFVNAFKSQWDRKHGLHKKLEIVSGDKILFWYDSRQYLENRGTLGNSCMKDISKNEYMEIYAKNPDTVSMVIITEEGKLSARAILWKLESETPKYYLDRIYTIQDSDQQLMYNWVLENLVKGDKSLLNSHYLREYHTTMKCKLNKTIFKKYPYADSMIYIYKKLENGVLKGDGFACNKRIYDNDDILNNYVVFIIQDTQGSENIQSHRFSKTLQLWIKMDEAVYVQSVSDYFRKEDVQYSNIYSAYYLKDQVVYSKALKDWIPKDEATNHPKYGIIHSSYLIRVIKNYIGEKINPYEIVSELKSLTIGSTSSVFEIEELLQTNREEVFAGISPNSNFRWFGVDLKVRSFDGSDFANFLCFKVYKSTLNRNTDRKILDMIPIKIFTQGFYYITELDAKFYGIDISRRAMRSVGYSEIQDMDFYTYEKEKDTLIIDETKAVSSVKKAHFEQMSLLHDYLINNSSSNYNRKYNRQKFIGKFGDIDSIIRISTEISLEAINTTISQRSYKSFVERGYGRGHFTDIQIKNYEELTKLFSVFYALTADAYDSKYVLLNYLEYKYRNFYLNNYNSADTVKSIFQNYIGEYFLENYYIVCDNKLSELGIDDISSSDFRRTVSQIIRSNEIIRSVDIDIELS